jgi:hypothetical protein
MYVVESSRIRNSSEYGTNLSNQFLLCNLSLVFLDEVFEFSDPHPPPKLNAKLPSLATAAIRL